MIDELAKHIKNDNIKIDNSIGYAMGNFQVEFYALPNGKEPMQKLLNSVDEKMARKLLDDIDMLRVYGNSLREPYSKRVSGGIFELRVRQSTNDVRALYFFMKGRRIIITNGFVKKQNKLPLVELSRAKRYRKDWSERKA
ncbi:type II toxin-antitoxin system RelE/ParE family toxin [Bifidobacterium sp. ESL0800]|uniref:type II toxin-antitoxin system RelE/ParE family toxin n=1 Tax=Bifidobacterium sp. ESL0800 TaxID=2983236 RepID=UPI0023F85D7A|nr:type II toxin-antitoxin system RelE/ParE family toxin [Bifidobacterium sp. ESL0800]WEV75185.1 type II toxin-antitoxin system RelE/ParE family toxin [Bifidobacterium sp. ESL0800]